MIRYWNRFKGSHDMPPGVVWLAVVWGAKRCSSKGFCLFAHMGMGSFILKSFRLANQVFLASPFPQTKKDESTKTKPRGGFPSIPSWIAGSSTSLSTGGLTSQTPTQMPLLPAFKFFLQREALAKRLSFALDDRTTMQYDETQLSSTEAIDRATWLFHSYAFRFDIYLRMRRDNWGT